MLHFTFRSPQSDATLTNCSFTSSIATRIYQVTEPLWKSNPLLSNHYLETHRETPDLAHESIRSAAG